MIDVGGRTFEVATKPGLFAHGSTDPAALLIAQNIRVGQGEHFVDLNCGNGLCGAVAAHRGAGIVTFVDRHIVSAEAAARTAEHNGIDRHRVFHSHGLSDRSIPLDKPSSVDVVAIRLPHDRRSQLQLLGDAFQLLREGGACYMAGATNEGVRPAAKAMTRVFGTAVSIAQKDGHHLVRAIKRGGDSGDPQLIDDPLTAKHDFFETQVKLRGLEITSASRPGVFSWEHADEATNLLAEHMRVERDGAILDLGCGSGIIGTVAASISRRALCMLDADSEAIRSAHRTAENANLEGTRVLASDVTSAVEREQFGTVLSNPPFHIGKAINLVLPKQFILQSLDVLLPGGNLQIVANRTLPYESLLQNAFGNYEVLHDGRRFKVLMSVKGN